MVETYLHINVSEVRSEHAYKMYVGCYGNKLLRQLKKGKWQRSREKKGGKKIIWWKVFASHHK